MSLYGNDTVPVLRLGITELWPLSTVSADGNVTGVAYNLWKYLGKSLNLSWSEVKLGQPTYEGKGEDGVYGGVFGHLQTKSPEVDVIILDSYAREDRMSDMKFSTPFDFTYTVLVSNLKGQCITTTYELFPEVSRRVIIYTTVLLIAIILIMRFDPIRHLNFNYLIIASLLRQPVQNAPRSLSGRLALGFLLLALVPLVNSFLCEMRANLVSCSESAPEDFAQILEQNKLPSVSMNSYDTSSLTKSTDANVQNVMKRIESTNGFIYHDHHDYVSLKKLFIDENRVFITPRQSFIINLQQLCMKNDKSSDEWKILKRLKLQMGSVNFFMKCICLPLRNNFPNNLLESMNRRILVYSESGLWINGMERIEKGFIKCMGPNSITGGLDRDQIRLRPVSLSGVVSAYKYWVIGLAISCYAFLIEMCVWKCSKCKLHVKITWN